MLKRNLNLNTLLFADDQVIIQDSEDKLQKSVYIQGGSNMTGTVTGLFTHKQSRSYLNHLVLNQMSQDYNLKIFTNKKIWLLKENS